MKSIFGKQNYKNMGWNKLVAEAKRQKIDPRLYSFKGVEGVGECDRIKIIRQLNGLNQQNKAIKREWWKETWAQTIMFLVAVALVTGLVFSSQIKSIVGWMEVHPVVSAGFFTIFGILLSAVLNVRNHTLNFISKTKSYINQNISVSKKSRIVNFFPNWNFSIFGDARKSINELGREDFRQKIVPEIPQGLLKPQQITICKQVASITTAQIFDKFDPEDLYEDAVKEKNFHGAEAAAIKYCQLFNKIVRVLENIAVEKNAKTQIDNLITVVAGLVEMIEKPVDPEVLRKQLDSCEKATLSLLAIIYEPN